MARSKWPLLALGLLLGTAAGAQEGAPRSAIDWLSQSIQDRAAPEIPEPPVAAGVPVAPVSSQSLGAPRRDAVGLLPTAVTGLPADAFATSEAARLVDLIEGLRPARLPALGDLLRRLLLAELDPPTDASLPPDSLFYARIDALLRFGALEEAQALMERAGPTEAEIFRRWFDVSLLTGHDAYACEAMARTPSIAPTLPARVFCQSRTGDWAAAALTLDTGRALGLIEAQDADLLGLFLDPEMYEGMETPQISPMTPLRFRLLDGIGEPPATGPLPLAFAVADLRIDQGWKARLEAAERLARVGALPAEGLRGLYTERLPAASGGVWDRAAAFQAFDLALLSGTPQDIADTLPAAWQALGAVGLGQAFATLFGERLSLVPLEGAAGDLAFEIGLLSPAYETVAQAAGDRADRAWLRAIALGEAFVPPPGPLAQALAAGLTAQEVPAPYAPLLAERRLGEALLLAAARLSAGAASDPQDIAQGLALLRLVGLPDIARRAALQMVLLDGPRP